MTHDDNILQQLFSQDDNDPNTWKCSVFKPQLTLPWQALYGIYLIRLCKQADMDSERTGEYVDIAPLSENEFKQLIYRGYRRIERWAGKQESNE